MNSPLVDSSHDTSPDLFAERYTRNRGILSPSLKRVADFINGHRIDVIALSAVDIAKEIGTSDATVVRAVYALGFNGLADLRRELVNIHRGKDSPAENLSRTLADIGKSTELAMDSVLEASLAAIETLKTDALRSKLMEALKTLHLAKRIVVFGLGPTAHIAAYAGARLRREGRKFAAIDRGGEQIADQLLDLEAGDALLMMAYGALYREAEATISEARRVGVPIVLISNSSDNALLRQAKVVLRVPRGRSMQIAHHGATLVCLEMLLLGLATSAQEATVSSLERLGRLRLRATTTPEPVPRSTVTIGFFMSIERAPGTDFTAMARTQKIRKAVLFGVVLLGILLLTTAHSRWPSGTPLHESIEWCGIVLLVVAILGRTWCTLYIGGRKISTLVDKGPYSVTRNPLYVFSVIGAVGAGAQFGSLAMGAIAGAVVYAIFMFVILREEKFLTLAIGSTYQDYLTRVPRFFPNFALWRDEEKLEILPDRVRITFFDGLFFLLAIPIAEGIETAQDFGWLPSWFALP